ncbi:hypothetical protein ACJDU8_12230 [Clostridium sp. WILCCON 0269]|uniref:Uncharacterized protein n=1 Tax=Candidatus Clostridium eludens TaxID=3381663 RepID=A0ABW8SJS5_9CLOT
MMVNHGLMMFSGISFVFIIIYLIIAIVTFVLFIRLATRGIKALDIYIDKNKNNNTNDNSSKDI